MSTNFFSKIFDRFSCVLLLLLEFLQFLDCCDARWVVFATPVILLHLFGHVLLRVYIVYFELIEQGERDRVICVQVLNDVRRCLELGAFEPLDHDIIVHVFERVRGVFLDVLAEVHNSLAVRALILLEVRLFEYFLKPVVLNHLIKLFRILLVFIYVCFLSDEVFDHFILS